VRMWSPSGGMRRAALVVGVVGMLLLAGGGAAYWGAVSQDGFRAGAQPKPRPVAAIVPASSPVPPPAPVSASLPVPVQVSAAAPVAVSAPPPTFIPVAAAPVPPDRPVVAPGGEAQRQLMTRLLALWGIRDAAPDRAVPPWPTNPDGSVDIAGVVARYQLSATYLPATTLGDLRAIGLPALVELSDAPAGRPYLLRWIGPETATLVAPSGEEARFAIYTLDPAWTRSAWVVWRNVDQLPLDPWRELSPTVLATIGLRLQKLGYLSPPIPPTNDSRFQLAVRRFQRAVGGLHEDGVVGPRTVMALSRVVGGRFNPTIAEASAQ